MKRPNRSRRGRIAASITAVVGLCLAGTTLATVGTGPANSAEPTGDCATAFPVSDLAAGDPVDGLTVTHGTTPERFSGEVLGVLDDAIAPDVDMIMVRLDSDEIDRVGIWEGMSGSPVYAADGRLIGAVAYGLATGKSPVAGVTPYEEMGKYIAAPESVDVSRQAARTIARRSDATLAQASGGFEELPTPLAVAGVGAQRLTAAAKKAGDRSYISKAVHAAGRPSAAAGGADDIVAGGNLVASLAYGDVTMAAIGTTTSVCDGRVVGFGHPLDYLGKTTLGLHPADTLYIQDDLITAFKVANLGDPVGTITGDRGYGISGVVGPLPKTTTITSTVTSGDRSRTGSSYVSVRRANALAETSFYEFAGNRQRVIDGPARGTANLSWTVTGSDRSGERFTLKAGNRFTSRADLTWRVGFEIGDLVYALGRIPGVTIDKVTSSVDLTSPTSTYQISSLQVRQHGMWTPTSKRRPIVVTSGHRVQARATLTAGARTVRVPVSFDVPRKLAGSDGILVVAAGSNSWRRAPKSVAQARTWVNNLVRHDEVQAGLAVYGRHTNYVRSKVVGQVDRVVKGHLFVPVVVR